MDVSKLNPILNKESILKTANARELAQAPQDVLARYSTYGLTHVPLGDTTKQLANLMRVIVDNKTCAVGTIVGPYGYGKTSTAVHLWSELREKKILSVPPFLWTNLPELMDAVYHWVHFEFSQGARAFIPVLDTLYGNYRQRHLDEMSSKWDAEEVRKLVEQGRLLLEIRPEDVVGFFGDVCELCEQAGYQGLAIFTDELQVTIAEYKPSRDQFFNDLFQVVKDILGLPGHWALVVSMNDDTEAIIARLRSDLLQRMQRSALYFRVKDVYNRREYPAELWAAWENRFSFDGSEVILPETLNAIGQVAARSDLGAGPRMVTMALSLAVANYDKMAVPYTPLQFVDDFLAGHMRFDQRGKFISSVRKALDNSEVRTSAANQRVVKLLAAYPMGCTEETLKRFDLLDAFKAFPPLARRELVLQQSGGYIVRYLAEEEVEPEQIEQRLTKEFVTRFAPGRNYAERAAEGFMQQVLLDPTFGGWKSEQHVSVHIGDVQYQADFLRGTFDPHYPDRLVAVLVAAVPQSPAPLWQKPTADAEIELRFELNYAIAPTEPSRLLIAPEYPNVAIFQLNISASNAEAANKILPGFLHDYYAAEQLTPLLSLALIEHLYRNRGDLPDDRNRISTVISPLRQYTFSLLTGDCLEVNRPEFASTMVGTERVKDLFRQQCRRMYPIYRTLIASNRNWKENLQQYNYALDKVIAEDGLSIARGRRPWKASKEAVADALRIPGRRLTSLETLLDILGDLIIKEEFSGRLPTSEVTLRFQLHPLETEWLGQLDSSREKVRQGGIEVPAIPAEQIMRQARRNGYTAPEIQEVLRLLQTRRFVDYDQRKGLLVRTVDAIDDLRDAVAEQISNLERQVQALAEGLPDFQAGRYPLTKLRTALAAAKERDEIEAVRGEVRQHSSDLSAFAAQRLAMVKEKLQQEQNGLFELARQGVPSWLGREFLVSPLQDLLEKQRRDLAVAYQAALDEIRQARDESVQACNGVAGFGVQAVVKTNEALIDLSKQSRRLRTRLTGYEDRREDLEGWRRVSDMAIDLNQKARNAEQVYHHADFLTEVDHLWAALRARFEAQSLAILGMHGEAAKQIETHRKRVVTWLESRRGDFDRQCQAYQQALADAGIEADLRVPFDQEHPTESYDVLTQLVGRAVSMHLGTLERNLGNLLQVTRYGIQVQRLPLEDAESRIRLASQHVTEASGQATAEVLRDLKGFQVGVLVHVVALEKEERDLTSEVQQAIQPRTPEGTEVRLMELISVNTTGPQTDLRELILRLLDQGAEKVNLNALMKDLQSLFQKNQIAIHISLLQGDHR